MDDANVVSETKSNLNHVVIRCLIPNKVAGGLIGKGGENIKTVRSVCPDATIKVLETPECPHAEERIVLVECDPSDIYAIFSQLIPQIFDGLSRNGFANVTEPEVCVLFSSVNVGSIIGKGGVNISRIREKSGASLKAFPNKLQCSDERVILIKGEVDKIITAISEIYTTIELDSSSYMVYNPATGASVPREAGVGGYQDAVTDGFDGGFRKPEKAMPGANGRNAQPYVRKPEYQQSSYHQPPQYHQDYNSSRNYQQESGVTQEEVGGILTKFIVKFPFSTYSGSDGEAPTVKEVTLENHLTGCIIGDKGSRIRDVRQSSGARIKIGDFDSASPGERLITIEGTNIQCHLAEYMLQCCVQSFSGKPHNHPAPTKETPPPRKKLRADWQA